MNCHINSILIPKEVQQYTLIKHNHINPLYGYMTSMSTKLNINVINDISVRTLLNVTNYILINKKHTDLCEKRKIIYFIQNDDMICIGYTILTRYGLVEYPIIDMVHIRQNKLIKSLIRKSKVLKNIQTNKLFTAYVCFTKKANMDMYVVKEIFHYL